MITTVDDKRRARIGVAAPGDRYWIVPKAGGVMELIPQKVIAADKKATRAEVLAAIRGVALSFPSWDEIRAETRQP